MTTAPKPTNSDEVIREHYRKVAEAHGDSPRSSMEDDTVREKELEWITGYFRHLQKTQASLRVLDLGCGNGYALGRLALEARAGDTFCGLDFSPELLEIARRRGLKNCVLDRGDARALQFGDNEFNFVYTERCLINILDWEGQAQALREIARVLKPGGSYLMIECFTDGLANNNKARAECGLKAIDAAYHNLYFEPEKFATAIAPIFDRVSDESEFPLPANFLSSHYFVSRVLYPALTRGEVVRNSEVAKFFSFLPPVGNYSPIQAHVLRKKA
jgi:ubiquinone/menaquinone biosynthesis C-methylase UbiE